MAATHSIHKETLAKRMLIGAGIAILPIVFLLASVDQPDPSWPKYWMIRPLIIVPLAGATGGAFFHFMDYFRYQGGWKKIMANVISVIAFIFILWVGTILGLDGTLWD